MWVPWAVSRGGSGNRLAERECPLPFASCAAWRKLLNLSEPHLWHEDCDPLPTGLLTGFFWEHVRPGKVQSLGTGTFFFFQLNLNLFFLGLELNKVLDKC